MHFKFRTEALKCRYKYLHKTLQPIGIRTHDLLVPMQSRT
jgi:hypothetical protein